MANIMGGLTLSLLDLGRNFSSGIGLSKRARSLNSQFLSQSQSGINQILSAGVAGGGSVEALQKQILAIRSRYSNNQLARSLQVDTDKTALDTKTKAEADSSKTVKTKSNILDIEA